jgi:hypothetical protein
MFAPDPDINSSAADEAMVQNQAQACALLQLRCVPVSTAEAARSVAEACALQLLLPPATPTEEEEEEQAAHARAEQVAGAAARLARRAAAAAGAAPFKFIMVDCRLPETWVPVGEGGARCCSASGEW